MGEVLGKTQILMEKLLQPSQAIVAIHSMGNLGSMMGYHDGNITKYMAFDEHEATGSA